MIRAKSSMLECPRFIAPSKAASRLWATALEQLRLVRLYVLFCRYSVQNACRRRAS
ncbi:hypothetical protein D3C78_1973610 [compost metagenome]